MTSEILLDLDGYTQAGVLRLACTKRWKFLFQYNWPIFNKLSVRSIELSKTSHGYHCRILVRNKIPDLQLNFLQLALGSDYGRECMNLRRIVEERMPTWNVLFSSKFKVLSQEQPEPTLSSKVLKVIRKGGDRKK